MSDTIFITKHGFRREKWDGEIRQNVEVPIKDIVHELRVACEIEQGVTLGDIFKAVSQHELLMYVIGSFAWCRPEAFHKEAEKPAVPSDLHFIELVKHIEIDQFGADAHVDVHGVGPNDSGEIVNNWSIELTPVNELASVPVRLDPNVKVLKDYQEIASAPSCFSLFEVLQEIYFEISFHGSPQDRQEFADEMALRVKEIKSGEAKLVPFDLKETVQ